jgi:glycosyltransferase involved in cell wall biosynthesis
MPELAQAPTPTLIPARLSDFPSTAGPLVSVIIPTYNGGSWIRETLRSALRQSYGNLETIVVDDGSQDSTSQVLREFSGRVRVIRTARSGIGRARNAGVDCAHGEYLAFLDHDDLWAEQKISRQVEFLERHPEIAVLYADADEFDGAGTHAKSFFGKHPELASGVDIAKAMVLKRAIPLMSTVMIRAAFLREHGIRFHPDASGVDDLWLLLAIRLRGGHFAGLDERLVKRRLHGANLSDNHYNRFSRRLTIYRDLIQCFPEAPARTRRLLAAGRRDANFRVGEWHWGQLDLRKARGFLRCGIGLDRRGIKSFFFWLSTAAPTLFVGALTGLKRRYSS